VQKLFGREPGDPRFWPVAVRRCGPHREGEEP
jgi:hypothetical protein